MLGPVAIPMVADNQIIRGLLFSIGTGNNIYVDGDYIDLDVVYRWRGDFI